MVSNEVREDLCSNIIDVKEGIQVPRHGEQKHRLTSQELKTRRDKKKMLLFVECFFVKLFKEICVRGGLVSLCGNTECTGHCYQNQSFNLTRANEKSIAHTTSSVTITHPPTHPPTHPYPAAYMQVITVPRGHLCEAPVHSTHHRSHPSPAGVRCARSRSGAPGGGPRGT